MTLTATGWRDGQPLVAVLTNQAFDTLHPRGGDGRFIPKPGGFVKLLDIASSMWVRARVDSIEPDGKVKITRSDTGEQLVRPARELYQAPAPKATLSPTGWKHVGGQAGSNQGGFYEDKDGVKWYVKTPASKLHVANEDLANRLYRLAGAPAPETAVSPDGKRFLTRIEQSQDWHALSQAELDKARPGIRRNFVVDAWLANWDGPVNDNLRVTPNGTALRVDAGGAVMFRARGGRRQLTPSVGELQSMRDPKVSSDGARLYNGLTRDEELDGARRILAIDPDSIRDMVKEEGLPPQTATELIARRAWLATHYGLQLPETTPEGRKLLADLKSSSSGAPTEADKQRIAATIVKLAPDTAVPLAVGAPVWVKNKDAANSTVTPAGARVPDIMVVKSIQTDAGVKLYELESLNGKVQLHTVSDTQFEVLRENYASPASKYTTGEPPQVGDRVATAKHGDGSVTELFPLYARVRLDDGSNRVVRAAALSRVAKAGTPEAKPPDGVPLPAPGIKTGPPVGKLAEISAQKVHDEFPLVAFSLPHRADVVVLSHDDANGKSGIMLGDGRKLVVLDTKLFDPATVDRAAVAALPSRTPGVRRAAGPRKPVDVTKLPVTRVKPNRKVLVDLAPGDRLVKIKNAGDITFLKIARDGKVTWQGDNKGSQPVNSDGIIEPLSANSAPRILSAAQLAVSRSWRGNVTVEDVTPARYDQAVFQLGAKHLDASNMYGPKKIKFSTSGWVSGQQVSTEFTYKPEIGDQFTTLTTPKSATWTGPDGTNYAKPSVLLIRGGKVYDLGPNGMNAGDPSKWTTQYTTADVAAIRDIRTQYWHHGLSTTPEPTRTLSDGTVLTKRWASASTSSYDDLPDGRKPIATSDLQRLNRVLTAADIVSGNDPQRSGGGIKSLGGKNVIEFLSGAATNWDKGNITSTPATPAVAPSTAPTAPAPVQPAPQLQDVTEIPGFPALGYRLPRTRQQLDDGEHDERLLELVNTEFKSTGQSWSRVVTLPDGTVQGDPLLAMLQIDAKADQNAPVVPVTAFNAIRSLTGAPVLYRGVGSQVFLQDLRQGNNFAGTGVSGNGLYSSTARGTARSYGSHITAFTTRPGIKSTDVTTLVAEQADAVGQANQQRMSILMSALGVEDFTANVTNSSDHPAPAIKSLLTDPGKVDQVSGAIPTGGESWSDYENEEHVRAALMFADRVDAADSRVGVKLEWGNAGYYYGKGGHTLKVTVTHSDNGGEAAFTFKRATGAQSTRRTRAAGSGKGFMVDTRIEKVASGHENDKVPSRTSLQYGSYSSDHYRDVMAEIIQAAGLGETLSSTAWPDLKNRIQKLDARISIISDPGRFGFLSGYDSYTIPQYGSEVYHIFTHRAAMVFKK